LFLKYFILKNFKMKATFKLRQKPAANNCIL
jgi:hypothetical protein